MLLKYKRSKYISDTHKFKLKPEYKSWKFLFIHFEICLTLLCLRMKRTFGRLHWNLNFAFTWLGCRNSSHHFILTNKRATPVISFYLFQATHFPRHYSRKVWSEKIDKRSFSLNSCRVFCRVQIALFTVLNHPPIYSSADYIFGFSFFLFSGRKLHNECNLI